MNREKIIIFTLTFILILFFSILTMSIAVGDPPSTAANSLIEFEEKKQIKYKYTNNSKIDLKKKEEHTKIEVLEKDFTFPKYDNVPLTDDVKQKIYDYSINKNFSYELILAIMKLESNFITDHDNGEDYGIMQWNKPSGTFDFLTDIVAVELNIQKEDVDWTNPYHNAIGSIWYLDWLRNEWRNLGVTADEHLFEKILISYNMGFNGTNKFLSSHGVDDSPYVRAVSNYKTQLERDGGFY
ncbi:transglycosylase SLT domain-containing protein [Chengkuizengella marina]|uniref:Lytic transglycosylase domain-containing protein n=1 Tax=Chengkuizengella marina TaxID=2507566 RepID=A0A6N9Q0K8_9BACL|nr:transglycosylase SLT domain-containing protein [Chengkuizengella marina]NBI28662.1 lytic transglycosylase domain-containing protein [Chengkuizengella marina]